MVVNGEIPLTLNRVMDLTDVTISFPFNIMEKKNEWILIKFYIALIMTGARLGLKMVQLH